MPIYANQRENGAADINFFFTKRCVTDNQAITKKELKIFLRVLTENVKNEIICPSGPSPLMHLSVKSECTMNAACFANIWANNAYSHDQKVTSVDVWQ